MLELSEQNFTVFSALFQIVVPKNIFSHCFCVTATQVAMSGCCVFWCRKHQIYHTADKQRKVLKLHLPFVTNRKEQIQLQFQQGHIDKGDCLLSLRCGVFFQQQ